MAAAVTHVGETVAFGLVFAFIGWAQMITALWLTAGRGRGALAAMSLTNVAALAGWVLSRTVGLPVLHPGVEPAGTADVITVVLEVLALVAAAAHLWRRSANTARPRLPLGLVAAGLFALAGSGTAVAALGTAGEHGHGEEVAAESGAHGHADETDDSAPQAAGESSRNVGGQPGTLPASLHRHRPGIYHLHENIDLHQHDRGIVHVHTKADDSGSSTAEGTTGGTDGGDHHDGGTDDGHPH